MAERDYELERLKSEMDAAQRAIDTAKSRLDPISARRDSIKREVESVKYRIADLKRSVENEYQAMKICYQARDKYDAENHKYRAQSFKESLNREYSLKESYYSQLNMIKGEFDAALSELRAAKDRKQRTREAYQARLAVVKSTQERERAKWKEKPCARCGRMFRYHEEWSHIPSICKECKTR